MLYLFISLIEVEHPLKTSRKEYTCRLEIDKITYSKLQSRATYDFSKNKPLLYRVAVSKRCSLKIVVPEYSCFCYQHFKNTNFKELLLVAAFKYSSENFFNKNDLRAMLLRISLFVFASFLALNFHNRAYY